jgi:hypothetical protein
LNTVRTERFDQVLAIKALLPAIARAAASSIQFPRTLEKVERQFRAISVYDDIK